MAEVNAAVLLAGGRSVRMGRDKTALEINGETVVERHLRQLRGVGVEDALVVCNSDNERAIRDRTGAWVVLQRGTNMTAAVRTGLEEIGAAGDVWIVCVNDIIGDADYARVASTRLDDGILIPSRLLDRPFTGGCLELDGDCVRAIVEKPPGGCRPGTSANIMVHRVRGRRALEALAASADYEASINELIASGVDVRAVPVDFWIAIKTPEDYERLNRIPGGAP